MVVVCWLFVACCFVDSCLCLVGVFLVSGVGFYLLRVVCMLLSLVDAGVLFISCCLFGSLIRVSCSLFIECGLSCAVSCCCLLCGVCVCRLFCVV